MCPACKEAMIVVELEGVEVDYCLNCHGVWLDTGELRADHRPGRRPRRTARARASRPSAAPAGASVAVHAVRASCASYRSAQPVVKLDCCPAGHGLWFDAGELAAVIQGAGGAANAHVADFLGQLFQQNTSDTKKG